MLLFITTIHHRFNNQSNTPINNQSALSNQFEMSYPVSFYIPSVSKFLDTEALCRMFSHIGSIERVDYAEMPVQHRLWRMAFVHLDNINTGNIAVNNMLENLENGGNSVINYNVLCERGYMVYYKMNVFKNKNPVKNTILNIHQIANNLELLEKTTIDNNLILAEKLDEANSIVEHNRTIIEEQQTRLNILENQMKMLLNNKEEEIFNDIELGHAELKRTMENDYWEQYAERDRIDYEQNEIECRMYEEYDDKYRQWEEDYYNGLEEDFGSSNEREEEGGVKESNENEGEEDEDEDEESGEEETDSLTSYEDRRSTNPEDYCDCDRF